MKKLIVSAIAAMMLAVTLLVGCGGDPSNLMQGTKWEVTTMELDGKTYDVKELAQQAGMDGGITVEFSGDKAILNVLGERNETPYEYSDGKVTIQGETYEVSGDTFQMEIDGQILTLQKQA